MKTISNLFSIENKKSTAIFLKILLLGLFAIMFMAIRPETASAASSSIDLRDSTVENGTLSGSTIYAESFPLKVKFKVTVDDSNYKLSAFAVHLGDYASYAVNSVPDACSGTSVWVEVWFGFTYDNQDGCVAGTHTIWVGEYFLHDEAATSNHWVLNFVVNHKEDTWWFPDTVGTQVTYTLDWGTPYFRVLDGMGERSWTLAPGTHHTSLFSSTYGSHTFFGYAPMGLYSFQYKSCTSSSYTTQRLYSYDNRLNTSDFSGISSINGDSSFCYDIILIAHNNSTASYRFIQDASAPTISTFTAKGSAAKAAGYTNSQAVTITYSGYDNYVGVGGVAYYEILEGSTTIYSKSSTNPNGRSINLASATAGNHTLTMKIYDQVGRTTSKTYTVKYVPSSKNTLSAISASGTMSGTSIGDDGNLYVTGTSFAFIISYLSENYYTWSYSNSYGSCSVYSCSMASSTTTRTTYLQCSTSASVSFTSSKSISITITDYAGNTSSRSFSYYKIDTSRDIVITDFNIKSYGANVYNIIGPKSVTQGKMQLFYSVQSTTYLSKNKMYLDVMWYYAQQAGGFVDCLPCTGILDIFPSGSYITADNGYQYDDRTTIDDWYSNFGHGDEDYAEISLYNIYGRVTRAQVDLEADFQGPTINNFYAATVTNSTKGTDGNHYVVGSEIPMFLYWYEPHYNGYSVTVGGSTSSCTVQAGYSMSSSTSQKTTRLNCNVANTAVSYTSSKTITITITDLVGNTTSKSFTFYKIDTSRDIVINSFDILAYGAYGYNVIGDYEISGGEVTPVYTLSSQTYWNRNEVCLWVGYHDVDNHFACKYIASGSTYVSVEDDTSEAGYYIEDWYDMHPDGAQRTATLMVQNIYGRTSFADVNIVFDYTAPIISRASLFNATTGTNGAKYIDGDTATILTYWKEANVDSYSITNAAGSILTSSISIGNMNSTTTYKDTYLSANISSISVSYTSQTSITVTIYDKAGYSTSYTLIYYRIDTTRKLNISSFAIKAYGSTLNNYLGPKSITAGKVAPVYSLSSTTYLNTNYMELAIGDEASGPLQLNAWVDCSSCSNITNIVTSGTYITAESGYHLDDRVTIDDWYSQFIDGETRYARLGLKNIYGQLTVKDISFVVDFVAPVINTFTPSFSLMGDNLTTGSDGEYYAVGDVLTSNLKFTDANPHLLKVYFDGTQVAHAGENLTETSTNVFTMTVHNDISTVSVNFDAFIKVMIRVYDAAGNMGSKPYAIYRIDKSRDIVINSFNIAGYGSSVYNRIGPMSVTGGKVRPGLSVASSTYLDANRFNIEIGNKGQLDAFICSSTFQNYAFITIENEASCSQTSIEEWYSYHPHGSQETANIRVYNIYGRLTIASTSILFDYVAPTLELDVNETSRTAIPRVVDAYNKVNRTYLGGHYMYYMSKNDNVPASKLSLMYPAEGDYGTQVPMHLSGGEYYLYVAIIETDDDASADTFTKDVTGNPLANDANVYHKISEYKFIYKFKVNLPYENKDDDSTSLEEEDINTGITSNPSLMGIKVFAIDRMLLVTFDTADTTSSYTLAQINTAISHTGYRIVSINDNSSYTFTKSEVFEETLVSLNSVASSRNELMDVIIIINSPQVVGDTATGATTFTQGDEIGNLGVSFTSAEAFDVQTQITLDGVLVKEVNTNRTGTYEIKTIAKDASGRVTRVSKTVVVEPKAEETKTTTSAQEVKTQELADSITSQTSEVKVENTQSTNKVENNSYKVVAIVETKTTSKKKEEEEEIED